MESSIAFWNDVAMECNRLDHTGKMEARNQRGPTLSSRALAIVHIGIHDAYVLSKRAVTPASKFDDPYLPAAMLPTFNKPVAGNAKTVSAAVSAAASVILLTLYPALRSLIDNKFAAICAINGDDEAGHRFGQQIAVKVMALRQNDGADIDVPSYMDSAAFGRHREDPLNQGQPFLGSKYGFVKMFACNAWHVLKPYPAIGTPAYLADHREVRAKGATPHANINTRTPEETLVGLYWAYDGAMEIGTPPRLYNQVIRKVAETKGLDQDELNRLLLLANLAMADAGIHAWFYKYHFDLWRPVVGIREFDVSTGPGTTTSGSTLNADCDPFWRPLGAPLTNMKDSPVRTFTPPFPAYPSGHATFGAASFHVARLFLKKIGKATIKADKTDDIAFEFVSDELNGTSLDPDDTLRTRHVRKFNGLHEAIYENSVSRIFLGVHWRFDGTSAQDAKAAIAVNDMIGGVPLGLAIAEDIVGQNNINPSPASAVPPAFETSPD
jgi:Vanadium chloroperoxidase N-terminal domain/PAP2 superfamily